MYVYIYLCIYIYISRRLINVPSPSSKLAVALSQVVKALITAEALRWCTGLSIDTWGCHLLKVSGRGRVPEPMGNCWFMLVLYYLIKENPWNSNPPTWSIAWLSTQKCRCRTRSGHNMYISNKCWKQKNIFSGFQMQTTILSFLPHESMWWFDMIWLYIHNRAILLQWAYIRVMVSPWFTSYINLKSRLRSMFVTHIICHGDAPMDLRDDERTMINVNPA